MKFEVMDDKTMDSLELHVQPLTDCDMINELLNRTDDIVNDGFFKELLMSISDFSWRKYYEGLKFCNTKNLNRVRSINADWGYNVNYRNRGDRDFEFFYHVLNEIISPESVDLPGKIEKLNFKSSFLQDFKRDYNANLESVQELFDIVAGMYEKKRKFKRKKKLYNALEWNTLNKEKLEDSLKRVEIAVENNCVKPVVVPKEENCLEIVNGKWKLHAYGVGGWREDLESVVANDTVLNDNSLVEVLEGVNSGGKTFDMKKTLYVAALALAGYWVPAESAKISVRDKIILREKGSGRAISAFQKDCNNVKEVLPNNSYYLIGMDEVFTSTEKKSGEALVYGLIKHVENQGKSIMVLSNHYPNLSSAFSEKDSVVFNHFPFKKESGKIVFPHTKQSGPMNDYNYGITVAEIKGFNPNILLTAKEQVEKMQILK